VEIKKKHFAFVVNGLFSCIRNDSKTL